MGSQLAMTGMSRWARSPPSGGSRSDVALYRLVVVLPRLGQVMHGPEIDPEFGAGAKEAPAAMRRPPERSPLTIAPIRVAGALTISRTEWTPVHSSSCGVLFRLCETLCVDTDHFAIPRTLEFHAHGRVPNLDFCENVLPPYHAKQERRCDLQKEEVSLSHQVES